MLGIDPMTFLREKDQFVRAMYQAVAHAAIELRRQHDRERAHILGEVLFGKQG